jgi:hypothetical protein
MNSMPYISRRQMQNAKVNLPASATSKPLQTGSQNYNSKAKSDEDLKTSEIIYKYGEFFPSQLSPFSYNETIAQEYFPLTKEQALAQGYKWKDPEERNYQITMRQDQIPDHIKDVPDTIVNEIIECASRTEIGTGPFFASAKNGPVPI